MTDGQFEKIASCESVVKTICYGALMAKMQVRGQFKWNQMHRRVGNGYSPGPGHLPLKDCLHLQEMKSSFHLSWILVNTVDKVATFVGTSTFPGFQIQIWTGMGAANI